MSALGRQRVSASGNCALGCKGDVCQQAVCINGALGLPLGDLYETILGVEFH